MKKKTSSAINVKGLFRLRINEGGKVVGDSGWVENTVTNLGFQHYIVETVGAIAGSTQASFLALGTGVAPGAAATNLPGELTDAANCRFTLSPSVVSSKTLRMVGTLASNIITAARTINNIGIFAVSTTNAGSILAGQIYATSSLATNQSVNCTYELQFS